MNTLVSIITPTYNCARFIGSTIESVLNQTYQDWELLITDDCSTDDTVDIVSHYVQSDSRIRLFKLDKNSGAGAARNNSIKEAKGKYLAFLDSDDRWLPTKLEKEISFMNEKHSSVVYSSYLTCEEDGKPKGIIVCRSHETAFSVRCDDRMGALTFMYDMEKLGKIYMPTIRRRQDWCYKMLVLNKARHAYGIKEPLAIYRLVGNSLSSHKINLIKYNIQSYRITLGWSWLRSILFFVFVFTPKYNFKKLEHKFINR